MKNIKKAVFTAALAATLVVPTPQVAFADDASAASCNFSDVSTASSFYTPVQWACAEEITVGYSDGTFRLNQNVTRGEFASFLYRYSGETHNAGTTQDFSDVPRSSSHFTAISWMKEKGYAKGYSDGTYGLTDSIRDAHTSIILKNYSQSEYVFSGDLYSYTTRGETVMHLYRMNKVLSQTPTPTPDFKGPYTDHKVTSWSNGKVTSEYRVYADHLDGKTPHGIIMYLHGDTAWEYEKPAESMIEGDDDNRYASGVDPSAQNYLEVAREKGYMLVVPRTPDRDKDNFHYTWWEHNTSGEWAADLYDKLASDYNVDKSKTYWVGFSGGADTISEQIMYTHGDADWAGGTAVIVGGGSMDKSPTGMRVPAALKSNYPMHWFMGENDSPERGGAGSDEYNALYWGDKGYQAYTNYGMNTKWVELKSGNGYKGSHMDSAWEAPDYLKTLLK